MKIHTWGGGESPVSGKIHLNFFSLKSQIIIASEHPLDHTWLFKAIKEINLISYSQKAISKLCSCWFIHSGCQNGEMAIGQRLITSLYSHIFIRVKGLSLSSLHSGPILHFPQHWLIRPNYASSFRECGVLPSLYTAFSRIYVFVVWLEINDPTLA